MKIIHLASVKNANANPGVRQQMEWESAAALKANLNWQVELWSLDPARPGSVLKQVPNGFTSFLGRRFHFHRRVRQATRENDVVIIRHAPLDPFSLFIPEAVRHKTWYVFHTLTGHYLRTRGGRWGSLFAWLDGLFTRRAIGKTGGIIGVTDELVDYELFRLGLSGNKTYVYPNGVFLDDWDSAIEDKRGGPLKIIFVASQFFDWNGLEAILESIVKSPQATDWELHLVGRLLPHQEAFIAENKLNTQIVCHGMLRPPEITALMASMDLSLGAFALEKVKAASACTLKVRESLAVGVPVYAGHHDVGLGNVQVCYLQGPADWGLILETARVARERSRNDVRQNARVVIDKASLIKSLLKELTL